MYDYEAHKKVLVSLKKVHIQVSEIINVKNGILWGCDQLAERATCGLILPRFDS